MAGAGLAVGLGEDHIPFDVSRGAVTDIEVSLPLMESTGDVRPILRIDLTSPRVLTVPASDGQKRVAREPTFGQLLRAGLRTLGPLHRLYCDPLPDEVFHRVKAAAEGPPTRRVEFEVFRQQRFSNRSKERYEVVGVTGWSTGRCRVGWCRGRNGPVACTSAPTASPGPAVGRQGGDFPREPGSVAIQTDPRCGRAWLARQSG